MGSGGLKTGRLGQKNSSQADEVSKARVRQIGTEEVRIEHRHTGPGEVEQCRSVKGTRGRQIGSGSSGNVKLIRKAGIVLLCKDTFLCGRRCLEVRAARDRGGKSYMHGIPESDKF